MECTLAVVSMSGWRGGFDPPGRVIQMADEPPEDQHSDDDVFFLTAEENALAEFLGELKHGDFARILNQLTPQAKDELRAAIGFIEGKWLFPPEEH